MWLLLGWLSVAAGPPSGEAAVNRALGHATDLYRELRFAEALAELGRALERPNSRADLLRIYELLGLSYAAVDQNDQAKDAFARLLLLEPAHELPSYVSPRLTKPFLAARALTSASGAFRASQNTSTTLIPGEPLVINLRLDNDPVGMAERFEIAYRLRGSSVVGGKQAPASRSAHIGLDIDSSRLVEGAAVDYWCQVLDAQGSVLSSLGSEEQPLTIEVTGARAAPPRSAVEANEPVWKQWWLWAIVGGVVLAGAGATAAVVASRRDDEGCPAGIPCGRVE